MKSLQCEDSVAEAVKFFRLRIAEQAHQDSISISDTELNQLSFSEETATPEEIAAARGFDEATDIDEFESKMANLLRRAFRDDVEHGNRNLWQENVDALRDHDIYVRVMLGQAGIPLPKPRMHLKSTKATVFRALLFRFPDICAALLTISGFIYFFFCAWDGVEADLQFWETLPSI